MREELNFLKELAIFTKAKNIVEIGVQKGDMAIYLCSAASNNQGKYYGFDLWAQHGLGNQFEAAGSKQEVSNKLKEINPSCFYLEQIDTIKNKKLFEQKLDLLCPNGIDFALIDGCHSYIGVANNFISIYPRLTETGIIIFHDTVRIDGCREFVFDIKTKYNDGSFDIIDLPYGYENRRCGISILIKKYMLTTNLCIDEICGSVSSPKEIEEKEIKYLKDIIKETKPTHELIQLPQKINLKNIGYYETRKKFNK